MQLFHTTLTRTCILSYVGRLGAIANVRPLPYCKIVSFWGKMLVYSPNGVQGHRVQELDTLYG